MNPEDKVQLSFYEDMYPLDGHDDVIVTRHIETGRIYIKKIRNICDHELYITLKSLDLPGIPKIFVAAEYGDSLIIIEEYISGLTLDAYIDEHGLLSESDAVKFATRLCEILKPLHDAKPAIIHRDIKPSNIMIDTSGNMFLLDFDAAKFFDENKNRDTILMGTAEYAAPEQYGFAQSDARTDIYAIGATINIMLTGRSPKSVLYKGSRHITDIISKCTSLDPSNRYTSVDKLKQSLHFKSSKYIPPGFRSGKPWKIITSSTVYLILIYLSMTIKIEGVASPSILNMYRATTLLLFLCLIFVPFNYMGILDRLPMTGSHSTAVRIFSRIFWTALITTGVFFICACLILMSE